MANSPTPAPAPRNQPVHEVRLGGIKFLMDKMLLRGGDEFGGAGGHLADNGVCRGYAPRAR